MGEKMLEERNALEPDRLFSRPMVIAVELIIAYLAMMLALFLYPLPGVFEPKFLLPILNTTFAGTLPIVVSIIAIRSYLIGGLDSILLMSCGLMTFGFAAILAGWLIGGSQGPNVNVTIYNVGALLGAVLHALGVGWALRHETPETSQERKKVKLIGAFSVIFIFLLGLTLASLYGATPLFFIQGTGPTLLRQWILGTAASLYFLSALFLIKLFKREKKPFYYWYAMSLVMISLGLVAAFIQPSVGSPMGWLNRVGHYMAGLYAMTAIWATSIYASKKGVPFNVEMTALFRHAQMSYEVLVETVTEPIVTTDQDFRIIQWNSAAERKFGYSQNEALGLSLLDLVLMPSSSERFQSSANQIVKASFERPSIGSLIEIIGKGQDLSPLALEVSLSVMRVRGRLMFVSVFRDSTKRKAAEDAKREEAMRIAATAFESRQSKFITNEQSVILQVNKAFTDITGYSAEEAVGQNPRLLKSGRHDSAFYAAMKQALEKEGAWEGEIWNHRKNGEVYPAWLNISAVKDSAGLTSHFVAIFTDISQRLNAELQIDTLSFYDPLTHLPNRRLLLDRLEQALHVSTRHDRKNALLFVDLDNFKTLNDTLGHHQGDMLLEQVAKRLTTCIRDGDTLARLGSDEFVVMLEDLSEDIIEAAIQVDTVGRQILSAFVPDFTLASAAHHATPSIGTTLFGGAVLESSEQPLKRAELAMFQAKAAGRNTLRFFEARMQAEVSARAAMEADLHKAVQKQQFLLYYQPQVVGTGRMTGMEALVRWEHPQRGMVSPAEFIPLAEESDLILSIGEWVLETACTQLAAWANDPALSHMTIAVNVSARQFKQHNFVDSVLATLARTHANPKRLKLELTEGMLVDDVEGIIVKMGELKARGVCFSLDDFGTGYSSLAHLKRLPLDQLKIDQGFVRNIVTDANDAAIARMVVALGESMGLSVIAEGVELQAQADFLAHQGCHAYQGYLFSKPLPLAALEAFARER